jgi:hypothetical protein
MNAQVDLLAQAKLRLLLTALLVRLGLGRCAKKSSCCPLHDDKSASFSVYINDDGEERWKCFAGCGGGDAIDFLAKYLGLSNPDACREFMRLAGVTSPTAPPPAGSNPSPSAQPPFAWQSCVSALTAEHRQKLADWRGYTSVLVEWLHAQNLIGLFDGERIAFPVHDAQGNVTACHYRLKEDGSWRYYPVGTRTAPFIIGDPATAKTAWVFESPWDLLAVLERLRHHIDPLADTVAIATRGAGNARLLAGVCATDAVVYAFGQNDEAGQKWLDAVAANCGHQTFQVVTPSAHKDANDWTRGGATADEIGAAITAAHPVTVSAVPDLHATTPKDVSKPSFTLPDETDEPETAPFPVDALPPAMACLIIAVSRCMYVPLAMPAVCVLGVVSAAIGKGLEIVSGPDRTTSANLYLLASGESGSGKSESCRPIVAPLVEYQAALLQTWKLKTHPEIQAEVARRDAERKALEKKIAKALRSDIPDAAELQRLQEQLAYPIARSDELKQRTAPTIIADDFTIEALAMRLQDNRETIFCFSSDARKPIQNLLGRYNPGKTTDESLLLKGYTREPHRADRAKGDPINLHRPCIALCWFVQPDLLTRMIDEESLNASGMLARLLLCHTHADWVKYDRTREGISDATRERWAELLRALLTTYHDAAKRFIVAATPEAEQILDHYQHSLVDRKGELADVKLFAARWSENAWRLALTLHAALHGVEAHLHPLAGETAANAVRVMEWFAASQLDILHKRRAAAAAEVEEQVRELLKDRAQGRRLDPGERPLVGDRFDYVTARILERKRIARGDAAKALLARMKADGLLVSEDITPAHGGTTTRLYRAITNPVSG